MYKKPLRLGLLVFILVVGLYYTTKESDALISNGANAVEMIGQYDNTSTTVPVPKYTGKGNTNNGPFHYGFDNPRDVAVDTVGHRLFVADMGNARVLVYNLTNANVLTDHMPDYVIGQPDFISKTQNVTQSGLSSPANVTYDPVHNRLFVGDSNAARVMVYDVSTITNGMNASYVIGQPDFVSSTGAVTQSGLSIGNNGLAYDSTGERLFVSDTSRKAVLVYDVSPGNIANGMNADFILGRSDFVTSTFVVTTNSTFSNNSDLAFDPVDNRLFVADTARYRVLVFDVSTITNGEAAVNVIGQANFITDTFTSNQINRFNTARGLDFDSVNSLLYVPGYDRVLVFNVATTTITNGLNASFVLGKNDFTSSGGTTSNTEVTDVFTVTVDTSSNQLYVVDGHRIAVFDVAAISNGETMTNLIGAYDGTNQSNPVPDYNKVAVANDGPNQYGFSQAVASAFDNVNHRFFVADGSNNRVLVYNLDSSNNFIDRLPDAVLGQSGFARRGSGLTQNGVNNPQGLAYDPVGNRLFVTDTNNARVLVFDVSTISSGENAVNVLGQADFTTANSATTQTELNYPAGINYDQTNSRLFVADQGANRVVVYDVSSITDGEAAINVLGQPDFTSNGSATTADTLNYPSGVAYSTSTQKLYVADSSNNRVLVYDASTLTDGEAAINVLGQADFTSSGNNVSQTEMSFPYDVLVDNVYNRLFVADQSNSRTLVFDVSSITDGEAAINVIGQPDYTTNTQVIDQSHAVAIGLSLDTIGYKLAVNDSTYSRIMFFDVATTTNTVVTPTSSGGGGGIVVPVQQYFNGTTYIQGTPTSTGSSVIPSSGNPSAIYQSVNNGGIEKYNALLKQNDLPDLIGGGESGVPKEFSSYVCQRYMKEYILPGQKNNPSEVKKLQIFLNENEGEKLNIDGTYDEDDIQAVKRFQAKYLDQIMSPWGVSEPTGRVFRTTTAKINLLMCSTQKGCPYFNEYLNKGDESLEAVKVQDFLNIIFAPTSGYPNSALPLQKEFDSPTKSTVENFQNVYKEIVLKPWDLAFATGRWYQTTRHAANKLMNCNEGEIKLENGKSYR